MFGAPTQRANTSVNFSAVSNVSTLQASTSQVSLNADSAGIRGEEVFPGDPMLIQKDCRHRFHSGQDFTMVCQALVWLVDWVTNDQVSNMLLPAQSWWHPGNAGWAARPCENRAGKSKRYYDAHRACFTLTHIFECNQLLLAKSNFIISIQPFFFF